MTYFLKITRPYLSAVCLITSIICTTSWSLFAILLLALACGGFWYSYNYDKYTYNMLLLRYILTSGVVFLLFGILLIFAGAFWWKTLLLLVAGGVACILVFIQEL